MSRLCEGTGAGYALRQPHATQCILSPDSLKAKAAKRLCVSRLTSTTDAGDHRLATGATAQRYSGGPISPSSPFFPRAPPRPQSGRERAYITFQQRRGARAEGRKQQPTTGMVGRFSLISRVARGSVIREIDQSPVIGLAECGISPASFSPKPAKRPRSPLAPRAPPGRRQTGKFYSKNANQRSTPSDLDAERRYTTHKRFARPLYLSKSSPPAGADLSSHRGLAPTQLTRASASTPPHPPGRNLRREVSREVRREASRCPTP